MILMILLQDTRMFDFLKLERKKYLMELQFISFDGVEISAKNWVVVVDDVFFFNFSLLQQCSISISIFIEVKIGNEPFLSFFLSRALLV